MKINSSLLVIGLLFLPLLSQKSVQGASLSSKELATLDKDCQGKVGLACAKLGYYYKKTNTDLAFKYYQKGCELKDETSCFNMKGLNPREGFLKKADSIMKFNTQNILNCHGKGLKAKYSAIQQKEVWHIVKLKLQINKEGQVQHVDVDTNLPKSFRDCTTEILTGLQFPKSEYSVSHYDYDLKIISHE